MVRVAGAPWPAGGGGMVGGHDGGDRQLRRSAHGRDEARGTAPPPHPATDPTRAHAHAQRVGAGCVAGVGDRSRGTDPPPPPPAATPEGGRRLGGGPLAPRRRRAHAKPAHHARGGTRAAAGRRRRASRARGTPGRLQTGEAGVVPLPRRGDWTGGGVGAARGSGVGGGAARRYPVAARPLAVAWAGPSRGLAGGGVWGAADEARSRYSTLPGRAADSRPRERGGPAGPSPKIHASDMYAIAPAIVMHTCVAVEQRCQYLSPRAASSAKECNPSV